MWLIICALDSVILFLYLFTLQDLFLSIWRYFCVSANAINGLERLDTKVIYGVWQKVAPYRCLSISQKHLGIFTHNFTHLFSI